MSDPAPLGFPYAIGEVVMAALTGDAARHDFIDADRRFHQLMYAAAGVPELFDLVRRRSGHVDRLRLLHLPSAGKAQAVLRDHAAIVDAIEARDLASARDRLDKHYTGINRVIADNKTDAVNGRGT